MSILSLILRTSCAAPGTSGSRARRGGALAQRTEDAGGKPRVNASTGRVVVVSELGGLRGGDPQHSTGRAAVDPERRASASGWRAQGCGQRRGRDRARQLLRVRGRREAARRRVQPAEAARAAEAEAPRCRGPSTCFVSWTRRSPATAHGRQSKRWSRPTRSSRRSAKSAIGSRPLASDAEDDDRLAEVYEKLNLHGSDAARPGRARPRSLRGWASTRPAR